MNIKGITKWNKMTLKNSYMFRLVMEKNNLCKPLIERVLGIKIKSLSYVEPEKSFEAKLRTKGIRLDLFVIDEDGVAYDIEMQMDNSYKKFLGKRSRYYVSLMDNGALKKDEPYSHLHKSYVIFICTFDPFGKGLAKYTFNAICNEAHSLVLDDGVTRVFINTEGDRHRISRELANLLGYISTGDVTDDYTRQLDEKVKELRNDTGEEVNYMTYMQTIMENRAMAYEEANQETALSMLKDGFPAETIIKYTKLTLEQVTKLAASLHRVH